MLQSRSPVAGAFEVFFVKYYQFFKILFKRIWGVEGGLSGRVGIKLIFPLTKQQLNRMLAEDSVLTGHQSINL